MIKKCAEKRLRELSAHNRKKLQEKLAKNEEDADPETSMTCIVTNSAGLMAGVINLGKSPQRNKPSIDDAHSIMEEPEEILKGVVSFTQQELDGVCESLPDAPFEKVLQEVWQYQALSPRESSATRDEPIGSEGPTIQYDHASPVVMDVESGGESDAECHTENSTLLQTPDERDILIALSETSTLVPSSLSTTSCRSASLPNTSILNSPNTDSPRKVHFSQGNQESSNCSSVPHSPGNPANIPLRQPQNNIYSLSFDNPLYSDSVAQNSRLQTDRTNKGGFRNAHSDQRIDSSRSDDRLLFRSLICTRRAACCVLSLA